MNQKQTSPFTVVKLVSISEYPVHALVSPSGDSILLSQDSKVSTLINTPSLIDAELGTYDEFLLKNKEAFVLYNEAAASMDEQRIFPKHPSDLLEDSIIIIRALIEFSKLKSDEESKNAQRKDIKDVNDEKLMKLAIEHALLLEQLVFDLSSNIERLQSSQA
ncbi:TPA: hypothetical protein MW242_001889 [Acinetobacter baumannii]|nr:hypothetical protein [Acinetobacter baumannii]